MDETKVITDHEVIKNWATKRQGKPQAIDDPISTGDKVGLRLDFPGKRDESYHIKGKVRDITWEEFFQIFEENGLGIIFQDNDDHNLSLEYFFIKRENKNL